MGSTKKQQYSLRQLNQAKTAKAIGHPARIAILEYLAENGFGNNMNFMLVTELSDATVCQHLKELIIAGLISERFLENQHYYFLSKETLEMVKSLENIITLEKYLANH
jgi:ArsR family transcriptional regulator